MILNGPVLLHQKSHIQEECTRKCYWEVLGGKRLFHKASQVHPGRKQGIPLEIREGSGPKWDVQTTCPGGVEFLNPFLRSRAQISGWPEIVDSDHIVTTVYQKSLRQVAYPEPSHRRMQYAIPVYATISLWWLWSTCPSHLANMNRYCWSGLQKAAQRHNTPLRSCAILFYAALHDAPSLQTAATGLK